MAGRQSLSISSPTRRHPVAHPTGRFGPNRSWVETACGALVVVVLAGSTALLMIMAATAVMWAWERRRADGVVISAWCRHLLAMTVAMYLGMEVYMALVRPAVISMLGGDRVIGGPSYTGMIVAMLVPMVVIMRAEGHDWRMCAEMSVAMVAPVVLTFALLAVGAGSATPLMAWLTPSSVYSTAHDAMLLGMIGLMVYRRAMYAGAAMEMSSPGSTSLS